MLMRLMSKGEYLIVPKGTKFMGSGKLGLTLVLLRVFPKHIFRRGVVATPLGLSILKVI